MNKTYIFLDTNNWIYLSNGFNVYSSKYEELHIKVFEIIEKRVKDNSIVFLTNDIIIQEWERNKSQASKQITDFKNKFDGHKDHLKAIEKFIGTTDSVSEIESLKNIIEEKYNEKIEKQKQHIKNVELFFKKHTLVIPIPDSARLTASNLAVEKKAPFIGEKQNSTADAIILLSSIEYLYENHKIPYFDLASKPAAESFYFPDSFFVSSNSGDFSSAKDRELIHDDLAPYLEKTKTKFYFSLGKLINALEEKFLSVEEQDELEQIGNLDYCEFCHFGIIHFSQYFEVFNPFNRYIDKDQYSLDFAEAELQELNISQNNSPMSKIATGECSECFAEFIQCECSAITRIKENNAIFECEGNCGLSYRVNADTDRKGVIYNLNYEIIKLYQCVTCQYDFEELDETDNCDECAEYNSKIND